MLEMDRVEKDFFGGHSELCMTLEFFSLTSLSVIKLTNFAVVIPKKKPVITFHPSDFHDKSRLGLLKPKAFKPLGSVNKSSQVKSSQVNFI